MTTATFPVAIVVEDEEPCALIIEVNEAIVDLYGAIAVYELISENDWIIEQDLPFAIMWNLDDDPKVYTDDQELTEFVTTIPVAEIPWDYELTLEFDDEEEDYEEE